MTLIDTIETALETSEVVINIMADETLSGCDKRELIEAILSGCAQ